MPTPRHARFSARTRRAAAATRLPTPCRRFAFAAAAAEATPRDAASRQRRPFAIGAQLSTITSFFITPASRRRRFGQFTPATPGRLMDTGHFQLCFLR